MPDNANKPDDDKTFADRLRRLREASGKTRQQAADAAGLEYSIWADWEESRRGPTIVALFAIAQALKCKVLDLLK